MACDSKCKDIFYVGICFNGVSQKHLLELPSSNDLPCSVTCIISSHVRTLPQRLNKVKFRAKILTTSPRLFSFLSTSKMASLINPHHYSYYRREILWLYLPLSCISILNQTKRGSVATIPEAFLSLVHNTGKKYSFSFYLKTSWLLFFTPNQMLFGVFVKVTTTSACSHFKASLLGHTLHLSPSTHLVSKWGCKVSDEETAFLWTRLCTVRGVVLGRGGSHCKDLHILFEDYNNDNKMIMEFIWFHWAFLQSQPKRRQVSFEK